MPTRLQRLLQGAVLVPAAALLGFLGGGQLAALTANSGSALADGATVALVGLGAAAVAAAVAAWSARHQPLRRLPVVTVVVVTLAIVATWAARRRVAQREADRREAAAPVPPPTTVIAAPSTMVDAATADSIVGLLALAGVDAPDEAFGAPLTLREAPRAGAPPRFTVQRLAELEHGEFGYEEPAAIVRGVTDGWYLLALPDGATGWVAAPPGSRFTGLAELVTHRLNYLTLAWDRRLAATPGGASERLAGIDPGEEETPAAVHATRLLGGTLWLEVSVFGYSPCEGDSDPPVIGRGWLPAWSDGEPTTWYYSRGC